MTLRKMDRDKDGRVSLADWKVMYRIIFFKKIEKVCLNIFPGNYAVCAYGRSPAALFLRLRQCPTARPQATKTRHCRTRRRTVSQSRVFPVLHMHALVSHLRTQYLCSRMTFQSLLVPEKMLTADSLIRFPEFPLRKNIFKGKGICS